MLPITHKRSGAAGEDATLILPGAQSFTALGEPHAAPPRRTSQTGEGPECPKADTPPTEQQPLSGTRKGCLVWACATCGFFTTPADSAHLGPGAPATPAAPLCGSADLSSAEGTEGFPT